MQVYGSSLLSEGSPGPSEANPGFRRILDVMVDPAVTMCTAAAEEKARLRPKWDRAIFVLNCLGYLEVRAFPGSSSRILTLYLCGRQECARTVFVHGGQAEGGEG